MTDRPLCRVLGPVRVEIDGGGADLGSPQQRVVLAVLAMAEGRMVTTGRLIDAVWGAGPPNSALVTLRTYVSRLRSALGASAIVTTETGYRLRDVDLDLVEARGLADRASRCDPADARRALDRALGWWTGEPLAGLPGLWAEAHRSRLGQWRVDLLERRLRFDIDLHNPAAAIAELTAICERYPLRESARALLMLALYRAGRQAEALSTFDDLRRALDTAPGNEIGQLHRAILRGDDSLGAPNPAPEAPEETDGGEALESLPEDVGEFTGRTVEVDRLCDALRPTEHGPVVAVVSGIAGTGKTALVHHVARRIADRFDRVLLADLRGSSDAPAASDEVLPVFLRALGIGDDVASRDPDDLVGLYRSTLADRRVLFVLDDAADAKQVRPLLPGAEGCAVLVTSRSRLSALPGDPRLWLDAMEPPDAEDLFARVARSFDNRVQLPLTGQTNHEAEPEPQAPTTREPDDQKPHPATGGTTHKTQPETQAPTTPEPDDQKPHPATGGTNRAAEPDARDGGGVSAVSRVVAWCGRLPLAVRGAAELLTSRPEWTVDDLADALCGGDQGLEVLGGDLVSRFAASYRRLAAEPARGFRLLAVGELRDWDLDAAAAVLRVDAADAEDLLEDLVDVGLLDSRLPGEYRYRDLLWRYARTLASPAERQEADDRLTEYLYARAADDLRATNPELAWRIDTDP